MSKKYVISFILVFIFILTLFHIYKSNQTSGFFEPLVKKDNIIMNETYDLIDAQGTRWMDIFKKFEKNIEERESIIRDLSIYNNTYIYEKEINKFIELLKLENEGDRLKNQAFRHKFRISVLSDQIDDTMKDLKSSRSSYIADLYYKRGIRSINELGEERKKLLVMEVVYKENIENRIKMEKEISNMFFFPKRNISKLEDEYNKLTKDKEESKK